MDIFGFGIRCANAPFANPFAREFLYFIQRPDRAFTRDRSPHAPRFFSFRNDVLPVHSRPTPLPAAVPA
ncbi:hypothetical protein LGM43_30190 [Burkholderia seminalis]|uniref:hypothetical protein n=1 Tax=Burkholderia seminalis TaxID=488731 RepID=UPI001907F820|nr:hypothetical protein [Burkholderia seminalis]MBJ9967809.1 hypothetical protein [Burkholderia seminalis]MCA7954543.1 hypothetical protein [Burkholderia seminalis]